MEKHDKKQHQIQAINSNTIANPNDEWYTPEWVLTALNLNFVYDPATTEWNAKRLNIPNFDTIDTDGLKQNWKEKAKDGDIWINPPFTLKPDFLKKAVEEIKGGFEGVIAYLAPANALTNKYIQEILKGIKVSLVIPDGRISFIDENMQPSKGAAFGSVILLLNTSQNKLIFSNMIQKEKDRVAAIKQAEKEAENNEVA